MVEQNSLLVERKRGKVRSFALVIKQQLKQLTKMKQVKVTNQGANFTAVNVGNLNEVKDYVLDLGVVQIPGKVFVGQALQTTGAEFSFQQLAPGQDYAARHQHKTHEELYFFLKGSGEFELDGEFFPVNEGSVVRVAPQGVRNFKNTGDTEMLMLCVQYKANTFTAEDANDGIMV